MLLLIMSFTGLMQAVGQDSEEKRELVFFENSQFEHDSVRSTTYVIKEGEFVVFQWITDNGGEPGNHSVAESLLAFQTESGVDEFELIDEEIANLKGFYVQRCRCQDRKIQLIHSGRIHGKKLPSGNWMIEIDVVAIGTLTGKTYRLQLEDEFKAADR